MTPVAPGLYLHIPFCSAICPYCDFSVLTGGAVARKAFVEDLEAEIDLWAEAADRPQAARSDPPLDQLFDVPFDTVYLGGGTPSALTLEDLERLLAHLQSRLPVAPEARLFFEANPEDVTPDTLSAWRQLGVATLSLGVQSFEPEALAFLGRRHTPAQGRRAVEQALEAGFESVSLDLIFGLPEQSRSALQRDLEMVVALGPRHVSGYQLTVHAGTPFGFRQARGELMELGNEAQGDHFRRIHGTLGDAGYQAYETSNFARSPEYRSRHNSKYWHHVPYLGLGPSAHSFGGVEAGAAGVTAQGRRWWNHRKPKRWREAVHRGKLPIGGQEALGPRELILEALMLGLRTAAGVDLVALQERYDADLVEPNRGHLRRLEAEGLVRLADGRLAPTLEGLAVADSLVAGLEIPPG